MNRRRLAIATWIAVLLPAILSLYGIAQRHRVEARNRAVTLATEIDNVDNFAAAQGLSRDQALERINKRGLNGIVLTEETINDLLDRGAAVLEMTYAKNPNGEPGAEVPTLRFSDPRNIERVQRGLRIRFGELANNLPVRKDSLLLPPVSLAIIRTTPIGVNPMDAADVEKHGLLQIDRFNNVLGSTDASVAATLAWGKDLGMDVFLPNGDQVLGRRGSMKSTAETLDKLHLSYASVEFGKIGGDSNMLQMIPERVVRLHAAQAAELDKMTEADAVERYSKAARERNMRILLIRPLSNASDAPLDSFGEFVGKIASQILKDGGAVGFPHGFTDSALPKPYFVLLGLSLVPGLALVLQAFVPKPRTVAIAGGLFGLAAVGCWLPMPREFVALVGSMIFPIMAYVILEQKKLSHPALDFAIVTAISLVGGLVVAGMLNGLPYFIGANLPLGVKIGLFAPIIVIGLFLMLRLSNLKEVLAQPITWGSAVLFIVVGGVLALLLARSGNDSGVGVSSGEIVFRNLLDRFLFVRPRTKEFMVGHPALVIGIGLLALIRERPALRPKLVGWTCLALMLGSVGQTGMINTLWHLHIPVYLSLARIGIGAVLGCTIGLGLWALLHRSIRRTWNEA